MAGSRQHYIPRMLLRRFADQRDQIRVVTREGRTFVAAVGNVALEKKFFGEPGPGTADEAISEEENRIAPLLQLASESPGGTFDGRAASTLITHFTVRLRGTRTFMGQPGHAALDAIHNRLEDPDTAAREVRQVSRQKPTLITEELEAQLVAKYGKAALKRLKRSGQYSEFVRHFRDACEQHIEQNGVAISRDASRFVSNLRSELGAVIERAHTKALLAEPSPTPRVEALWKFTYELIDFTTDGLVLGDAVAWATRPSVGAVPLFALEDDITAVVMPISPRRVLLGWIGPRPQIETGDVVAGSIQCSEDFVIAYPGHMLDFESLLPNFGRGRQAALEHAITQT